MGIKEKAMTYRELLRHTLGAAKVQMLQTMDFPGCREKELAIVGVDGVVYIYEAHLEEGRLQYQEIRVEDAGVLMSDPTGSGSWLDTVANEIDLSATVGVSKRVGVVTVPADQTQEDPYDNPL
jgi:hypothetical protein